MNVHVSKKYVKRKLKTKCNNLQIMFNLYSSEYSKTTSYLKQL